MLKTLIIVDKEIEKRCFLEKWGYDVISPSDKSFYAKLLEAPCILISQNLTIGGPRFTTYGGYQLLRRLLEQNLEIQTQIGVFSTSPGISSSNNPYIYFLQKKVQVYSIPPAIESWEKHLLTISTEDFSYLQRTYQSFVEKEKQEQKRSLLQRFFSFLF